MNFEVDKAIIMFRFRKRNDRTRVISLREGATMPAYRRMVGST
jgi:hypothetical protein